MKMILPKNVSYIISKLEQAGYEAYAVGGCVRDTLLERKPQDWDITTSAKPLEIKQLFKKTIDTGIQHGTVAEGHIARDHHQHKHAHARKCEGEGKIIPFSLFQLRQFHRSSPEC